MHVYKETNDEIKKLPETLFLLKNYAVVFISYTHVSVNLFYRILICS